VPKAWDRAVADFDEELPRRWDRSIREEWDRWRQREFEARATADAEWWDRYYRHVGGGPKRYPMSEKWRVLRQRVFHRSRGLCDGCGVNQATQVHHRSYDHLGDEFLWELAAVCLDCHRRAHPNRHGECL
jgi:5-methylcytosine-specific restriction endonuclease McrA